jgi:hypothetical protein
MEALKLSKAQADRRAAEQALAEAEHQLAVTNAELAKAQMQLAVTNAELAHAELAARYAAELDLERPQAARHGVREGREEANVAAGRGVRGEEEQANVARSIGNATSDGIPDQDRRSPEEFFREPTFRARYRRLCAALMFVGATEAEAEDAVQGALEQLLRDWGKVREPQKWVPKVALRRFYIDRLMEKGDVMPEGDGDQQISVWEDRQWVDQMLKSLTPKQ